MVFPKTTWADGDTWDGAAVNDLESRIANATAGTADLAAEIARATAAEALASNKISVLDPTATAGTLTLNALTPVDATGGPKLMFLPTGSTGGDVVATAKHDAGTATVKVAGNLRGTQGTATLNAPNQTIGWASHDDGSWWQIFDIKPMAYLQTMFEPLGATERVVSSSTFNFAVADANNVVTSNSSSTITGMIQPNGTVAIPVGSTIFCWRRGTGRFIIAPGAGVTFEGYDGSVEVPASHTGIALYQASANNWEIAAAGGIQPTLLTAKGSLITATGAGVPVELQVSGTDDNVLTEDSSQPSGLVFKAISAGAASSFGRYAPHWPIAADSYIANMSNETASAALNITSGRMQIGRAPFFVGKTISQLSFVPAGTVIVPTNHWACLIDATTKTVIAASADAGTAALTAGVPYTYTLGTAYIPSEGDVLAWGFALVGTGVTGAIRGQGSIGVGTPAYGAAAFPPCGVVTAGTGSAVTTPLLPGVVLGTLAANANLPYCEIG